ncbi:MAG: ABC transporter ATP-binding protein/permease [Oscillospiraceae bacterium]|jgi:ATP-binding cassette subfamily B protein|nr:ABC transporter ATP-binding protein/permease [Oscillospiraceae bacterium]
MENENIRSSHDRLEPKLWKRLLPFLAPSKKLIIALLVICITQAGIEASYPLFTKYAINNFAEKGTSQGLLPFVLVYLGAIIAASILNMCWVVICMRIDTGTAKRLRHEQFLRLQSVGVDYFAKHSVGYLTGRFMSDTGRVTEVFAWLLGEAIYIFFIVVVSVIIMLTLSWQLGLITIAVIPVVVFITFMIEPKTMRANRRVRELNSLISGSYNEGITGVKTAKSLVAEEKFTQEFRGLTGDMYRASRRVGLLGSVILPAATSIGLFAVGAMLYRAGILVDQRLLDYGTLAAFITFTMAIIDPVAHLAFFYTELLGYQAALERVVKLLDEEPMITDTPEVTEKYGDMFNPKRENWEKLHGDVEFSHVWFRYPESEKYILEDFCLDVPRGKSVAIVGETGAGKSTIVNLACRFYEPERGAVLIDGRDSRERSQLWLHSGLGYVLQDPQLFSGTIRENIRYGRLDATDAEVEAAARLVCADKVAEHCENGYETQVGEGGAQLSTGQKQLISFARAVLADPPIFVLDEATSSIDTETERLIQDAIGKALSGRTSFIIAHRLSTIMRCDLILVVDDGKVIERGTHRELIAKRGRYRELFDAMRIEEELSSKK